MARNRQRQAAARLLRRYGVAMTFQRVALTKSKAKGSQASGPVGSPISANATLTPAKVSIDHRVAMGDEVLMVDGAPFAAAGVELADGWRVTLPGGEIRPISEAVIASRTRPGDPAAYYETMLRRGGAEVAGG